MSWAAIGAAVAGAAVSVGAGALAAQNAPQAPDLASASREMSNLNAELLPLRRQLESAAQQGKKVTIANYPEHQEEQYYYWVKGDSGWAPGMNSTRDNLQAALNPDPTGSGILTSLGLTKKRTEWHLVNAKEWEAGGKFEGQAKPPWGGGPKMETVPAGPKTFDFTGYGEADANAAVAQAMTKAQLALQQKYGVEFATTAAEQAKLADPEGTAARAKMNELIQAQINRTPDRSIATTLDKQIQDQLDAGNNLTGESRQMLDESVRQAMAARGGQDVAADFSDPLTQGFAGEARREAGTGKALNWLSSGLTPQDADYRESQQNMSNLSALVNGTTPQSQFSSLSAPGPTPTVTGAALPQMPNNSGAGGANAIDLYNTQIQQQQSQVNPWMAGLSGLLSVGNTYAATRKV